MSFYTEVILKRAPYIVAEVGSNFTSINDCEESVKMAKVCGADAVKFQCFDHKDLYGYYDGKCMLEGLRTDWVEILANLSTEIGIDFMCTPFSPSLVKHIDPYVKIHKLASSDITDPVMLAAVHRTGKPIIMSCGGATLQDVELALNGDKRISWRGIGDRDIVLLYCNSGYPSYKHNPFKLNQLKSLGKPVGLSDHSLDVFYAPLSAVRDRGCIVLEKHFKLRDDMTTADAPHSLTPGDFKSMVDAIRETHDEMGPSDEEEHMILRNHRRIVATKRIISGETLARGVNYGAFRSKVDALGMSPFSFEKIEGRAIDCDLNPGDVIIPSMLVKSAL